jgi:hypothetical protein
VHPPAFKHQLEETRMMTEQELTVTLTESGHQLDALMVEVVAMTVDAGVTTQLKR